jgi:hypothetical protein
MILEFPIIIGLKNCRVKNFSGKCLATGEGFRYELNPVTQVSVDLSEWYDKQDANIFQMLPYLSGGNNNKSESIGMGNVPILTIAEGQALVKGKQGKNEYFGVC